MTTWMDKVFEGAPVPPWLRRFEEEPVNAVHDLLLGIASLGHLSGAEPEQLLLDWIEILGPTSDFPKRVDIAFVAWIERSWGEPLLGPPPSHAARTALAWCRATDVIAAEPAMKESAKALKEKVLSDRNALGALTEGASRDPLGRAWLALAAHQEDRGLVDQWWQLCRLPPNEPWYRGVCGIRGLRGLPPASEAMHRAGGFPVEVARGLVALGTALAQRADDGWLNETIAQDELQRTARLTMAAYPVKGWDAFWEDALQHRAGDTAAGWMHSLAQTRGTSGGTVKSWVGEEPYWDFQPIADRLANGGTEFDQAVKQADVMLGRQQRRVAQTGDAEFLVRTACNFAARVRHHDPKLALAWLHLARRFEPWNAYTWSEEAVTLLDLSRLQEALCVALEATERFPDDVVAHTTLAQVLRAQDRLGEAEAQYRLTIERFPENVVAQQGLDGVRRQLQRVRVSDVRLTPPPDDVHPVGAEATAVLPARSDARPSQLSADELETLLTDASLLRHWSREIGLAARLSPGQLRERAHRLLTRLAAADARNSRAAGERGLLTLTEGDIETSITLLREAVRRFPGSARVRYALAHAERRRAQQLGLHLDPDRPDALAVPWRQLERINPIHKPVRLLGEARSWLAQVDGATVEAAARKAFGQLGYWMSPQIEREGSEGKGDEDPESLRKRFRVTKTGVAAWWSREVQIHLFGSAMVTRAEDLGSLDPIRERLTAFGPVLDGMEESWVNRHAQA